jgi:hypothetical protein
VLEEDVELDCDVLDCDVLDCDVLEDDAKLD